MVMLLVLLFIARSVGHSITSLEVPRWAEAQGPTEMRCVYARNPHDPLLHSVKWYRDQHEIFRYIPQEMETRAFNSSGITITNSSCNSRSCTILVQPERGMAKYTCEVSSEGPRFAVNRKSANMTLAVLPEYDPLITGLPTLVNEGDEAVINCTSDYSLPPATIDWFVDDEPDEDNSVARSTHISEADADGLRASWRALRVLAVAKSPNREYMSLRCRATLPLRTPLERNMAVRLYITKPPNLSKFTANSMGNGIHGITSSVNMLLVTLSVKIMFKVPLLIQKLLH